MPLIFILLELELN